MRYVVPNEYKDVSGKVRVYWYWQRKGYKRVKLSDDEEQRFLQQLELNAKADAKPIKHKPDRLDSVREVAKAYEQSDRYTELAHNTQRYYDYHLRLIMKLFGDLPIKDLTRQVVVEYIENFDAPSASRNAASVLSCLFHEGQYRGYIEHNPAQKLRLKRTAPRQQVWTLENIQDFLDTCEDPLVTNYFMLCRYTAQRPGDCAAMTWKQYDGDMIELIQQKTKKRLWVPVHQDLKRHLDNVPRDSIAICGVYSFTQLRDRERPIRKKLGIDAQVRDLRRTAMVAMSEAGATIQQIAAVSGHSIERARSILETYIPRNAEMAKGAVVKWESLENFPRKAGKSLES